MNFKRFLSLALAFMMVFSICPMQVFATGGGSAEQTGPDATVTVLDPITLKAGEYDVFVNNSLTAGTEDLPLQVVMNFQANDTAEEAANSKYGDWLCDFKLTFDGLEEGQITADNCYLAGNYGIFEWIAIPTDGLVLEEGVEYPVVSTVVPDLTYETICKDVQDFTAAIYIDPEILEANPNFKVSLSLEMEDKETQEKYVVGEPAEFDAEELLTGKSTEKPDATVTVLDPMTLKAGEYDVFVNNSLTAGTEDLPLQVVMNFKANDTAEEAAKNKYGDWLCDFKLTFDGLEEGQITADNCYLAGNYGIFEWIAIPTDGLVLEEGVEYPVVSTVVPDLTYETICKDVQDFTAAIYIAPEILAANPNFKVSLGLEMTNPENPEDVLEIGKPAVYTAKDLLGETKLPEAEVTVLDPVTLKAGEYDVWGGGDKLTAGTEDLPLQIVMNFKANDTLEEAKAGGYGKWLCDFTLKFEGFEGDSISGDGSYLAGNYGIFEWIAIPTDGETIEEGKEYPIVAQYDPTLNYEDICGSVKDFTAALYIDPETVLANPDIKVTLKLKMTNPDDANDYIIIGEPAVYTFKDLITPPDAEVTVLDPITLKAGEYDVWGGGDKLTAGTEDLPLQIVMNFKANDTLEEAKAGGYGKWLCDFTLKFEGFEGDSISGDGSYLAGNYGIFEWIAIPTDGETIEEGKEYPIVAQYDPTLNYEDICGSVKDFTAALYIDPETVLANPDIKVTLKLKMTNPDDANDYIIIGEPAVYTFKDLLAGSGYVAMNKYTEKCYTDVNTATMEAKANETVVLLKDAECEMLWVRADSIFDLNGYTLKAEYVSSFGDLVDNSDANSGLLVVPEGRIMLQQDNTQLPVNTADGYRFITNRGLNQLFVVDENKYVFQPLFNEEANKILLENNNTSGVKFAVRVTYEKNNDVMTQNFTFKEELVAEYLGSYKPGNYGKVLFVTLKGAPDGLTYQAILISETGAIIELGNPVEHKNPTTTTTETQTINAEDTSSSALVAEGTKVTSETLTLAITQIDESKAEVTISETEEIKSVDVHIEGIADDNTVPAIITVKELASVGLNEGNLSLYHVENGETVKMTQVATLAEVDAHNEFYYDPATGDVTMALATFSEVAVVSEPAKWEGNFDYSWYTNAVATADGEAVTEYAIANADQLAAFGAIVGGMNGQTQDSFAGKTVKLLSDINLGDKESENESEIIFYPIGYYNSTGSYEKVSGGSVTSGVYSFEGTFDGNGHTISNFYQNTWEMFGDYNDGYSAGSNYYKDAMGLFGYVVNGTVKNLTVDNFSSDGEFTPTGVIAAYAVNSTFENIAITNCNPRVYNTGNGGIVGIGGNSDDPDSYKLTFTNITIDNTNKITALWGSWDVACGGLVGMFRGAGHVYMTNCHVAAQIDVYNDVCGNYQYYWYRYSGMMVGTNKNMTTDANGYTVPETDKFHAENCTVHFGDWNDYYYCELVANSLASYTHDHQFSRLEQIQNVSEIQDENGNWSKTGNFILMNCKTPTETCYHIVNKNGTLTQHLHTDAGEETVNGETVLKEDKQIVYLPFNQLFTGYGWGVKHVPIYDDGTPNPFAGVTILDREVADSVEKFETKFTGDFLYRVGNKNTVALGSLFAAKADATINNSGVVVSVDKVDENSNASGTFTANTSDWTKGTIQFSGTGVVKVTIQDYNFCTPTVLYLEVVDATNLTSAKGTTSGGNFVLLCDVNTTSYVYYWNCNLYGNGFTYSLKGAPTNYSSSHGHGIIMTQNATLDNIVIVGDIYDEYGAYTNNNDYNAAIDVMGDTTIQNCYISGCSAPISTRANATIKNTTLYGGAVANLIIKGGTVTLENVTTANYNDGRSAPVGMGIVIHSDAGDAKLILNGTLTQYNFIYEKDKPSDTYAEKLHEAMFGDSCADYHFGTAPERYVNTGIISMSESFGKANIIDNAKTGYVGKEITLTNNGYVYTQPNTIGEVNNNYNEETDSNIANAQGAIPPSYSFDYTTKNYVAKTDGSNDYCYYENGKVNISMDEGDTFNWDTSILTVTKEGKALDYTVYMNDTDYSGKSITFNASGEYEVVYTYIDPYNYRLDENGKIETYEETYTKTVYISVAAIQPSAQHATFTFADTNTTTEKVTVDDKTYISAKGVSATDQEWGYITVNETNIFYPITEAQMKKNTLGTEVQVYYYVFKDAVTITDYAEGGTGGEKAYDSSTTTMPSNLTVVNGMEAKYTDINSACVDISKLTKDGPSGEVWDFSASTTVSGTTTYNNYLAHSSPSGLAIKSGTRDYDAITVAQFSYTDEAGATYYYFVGYFMPNQVSDGGGCVTPDTLVTLADGSQVRVDSLSGDEELLVWNLETGTLDTAPILFVDSDPEAEVEVAHLYFSDGSDVKVIYEHGFWDYDLNKYVYLDENAEDYIGHSFAKQNGDELVKVELVDVVIETEVTTAWSPVTAGHLCYFVNGMLSMPGGVGGLFNIFEVDPETMMYDFEAMEKDIEKYGLFTYEEVNEIAPLSRKMFEKAGGAYLKVSIGKGNMTIEDLKYMINRYNKFFE